MLICLQASISLTAATISVSSARRPTPGSSLADAMRPSVGPTKRCPQLFRVSTFRTVAGLCHISGFIAGAQRTRFAPARMVAESRSSPSPIAARAIESAVAGAIRTRSAQRARETCSTRPERSHQVASVCTGEPAATESVSSGIKRKAASVATALTSCPASLRRRITPGALYAAMPPVIPTSTLATRVVYRAGTDGNPAPDTCWPSAYQGWCLCQGLSGWGLTRGVSTWTFFGKMHTASYHILMHVYGLAGPSTERGENGGRRAFGACLDRLLVSRCGRRSQEGTGRAGAGTRWTDHSY